MTLEIPGQKRFLDAVVVFHNTAEKGSDDVSMKPFEGTHDVAACSYCSWIVVHLCVC